MQFKSLAPNFGYAMIVFLFIIINLLILHKWIVSDYDNNYAGGLIIPVLGIADIVLNVAFLIGFIVAGITNKSKRKLYLLTASLALIPIGILVITG
jgi:hypothetical protein